MTQRPQPPRLLSFAAMLAAASLGLTLVPLAAGSAVARSPLPQATRSASASASATGSASASATSSASASGSASASASSSASGSASSSASARATTSSSPAASGDTGGPTQATVGTGAGNCTVRPGAPAEAAASGEPITFDHEIYAVGNKAVATAKGFTGKEKVQVVQFGTAAKVTTVVADKKGRVSAGFTIPDATLAGPLAVQFIGWCSARVAVGRALVGRTGAGAWPTAGYPGWVLWAGAGVLVVVIGYLGWQLSTSLSGSRPKARG